MAVRANVDLKVNMASVKRSMDRAAREINKTVQNVSGKDISFNVNGKSFTQPLGRITASANEFTKSLEASNARVIAFGASVGIINAITDSFKFLVAETIRFEKTLQDINVVLNSSNEQIEKFGQGLFDVAQNTAQSFNIAAEAALEFSRQGLSVEEVLKRTNDALTLTRITSLDAAEAVSGLTAAVNAFGEAGLTTTDIIDKLAAVDVKFAVSSEDLINGLERAGAVAIDAGVDLDNLVGIITSLQQTTARGGAVIGNGLKTIFTRIQRPESIRQLEDMGVAVRTLTGAVLPADKVLKNIAKGFEELSQSQQSNIVQFAAGIFQANIFRAALADLAKTQGIQQQATEISANAAGEAARKNELLNKSISAMASQAGSGLKELVGIIGELSIKQDLGEAVGLFGNAIESLKNALGGGEEEGNAFAKGLVRGIGNVLTGPAAIAFVAIFTKLLFNVFKFASGSLKDVLGIVTQKEKVRQIEESIVKVLGSNVQVTQALNRLEGDRVAQEQYILGIIEAQTNALAKQQQLASKLGPALLKRGITPDLSYDNTPGTLVDIDGDGVIRSAGGLLPQEKNTERKGAIEAGYSPGKVTKMKVPGMGEVIYNTAEKVKNFEGMKQPAIMPPQSSRAGRNYKEKFSDKHGFDPYASGGFIPNFAPRKGSDVNKVYQELKNAWLSGGYRMTNKELTDATGLPGAPDNPYKKAHSHFDRDFGAQLNKAGYTVNARPHTEYYQYLQTNKEKIAKFIQHHQDPEKKGIAIITDDDLMDKFLKQKNLKSASGHYFQAAVEAGGRSKISFANSVTSYRNQFVNRDKLVAPPIYLKDDSTYVGPPNSSPWANVSLESKGKSKVNATGKEIDSVFNGIKSGAPQSFLGLDKRFDINPLTKKELADFKKQNFSANVDHYGFAKMQGNPPKPVFLSYNTLANAPYSLNANGFEHAISDFKRRKRGLAGSPLDFIDVPGEAKFGPTAYKNTLDEHLTGKFLRHLIGTDSISWPPRAGYGSLGRLEYFHTESFGAPTMKHIEQRNKQAHNIKANLGLIPNFADDRTRSEKIQSALNDPANANIKFKAPANITPAQISRVLKVPMGEKNPNKYSDSQIKNAISETIQTRKNLELPGFENLDNVDVNSVLKKYKESIKGGKYYGNKDLSYSSGLVPNFVDKVQNGAIYYSKPHNKIVRVTRVDNDKKIARIKHHGMEKYKDEEVFFKDLEVVSPEQAKKYYQKKSSGLVPNFVDKVQNGAIYYSKPHNKIVRVTRVDNDKKIARIKHHGMEKYKDEEVFFKDLEVVSPEQAKKYYQKKSSGFVPNFASVTLKNNVTGNQEKMNLKGTPFQNFPKHIQDQIRRPDGSLGGGNIKFKTPSSNLKTSTFKNIGSYLEALGVDYIETTIPFDFIDLPVNKKGRMTNDTRKGLTEGTTKQRGNFAESKFLESDVGKEYLSTSLDDQAVVDAISSDGAPTEVKSGNIKLQNIFEKSIRRYSNKKFRDTLESVAAYHREPSRYENPNTKIGGFSTSGEIADALSQSIAQIEEDSIVKNLSTLARMGEYTIPGMTKEELESSIRGNNFRNDLLASGIGQDEKDILNRFGLNKGFVPNYKKLYQAYIGDNKNFRSNRTGDGWYFDSQKGTDAILDDWRNVVAKGRVSRDIEHLYAREYSISDSNLKEMTSGIYSSGNLRKLRVMSRAFQANNSLPNQYDEEWEDDLLNNSGEGFDEAYDEMEGRFGAYSRLRNTKKNDRLWKASMAGTKDNPRPLATYKNDGMFGPGYIIPDLGPGDAFRDGFTIEDDKKIRSIFSPNLNRDNYLIERKISGKHLDNKEFFEITSEVAKNPEKAMNASRRAGKEGMRQHVASQKSKGLIPNFAFKNSPVRLDGGFGRRGRIIQDEDTGSFMTYVKDGANVRDIDFLQSNKRGDAYKMIRGELEGKFMKRGGKYTSRSIKQQKSFKQGSSSNFEDLLYAFPQLRYRMQEGALTSGRLINEALGSSHKFNRIKDLESHVNKINRKDFQNTLGTKEIGNRILITDLSTGLEESKNRSKGLVPNFSKVTKTIKAQEDRVKGKGEFIGRGLSEGDKDIAFNMFDYFISKISGLSSSFGFNDARASLTGTPDDRNLIETFKTSGKSEKDLIQIAGSQRKLKNILDGYMLGHFETLLLAKGKFKEAKDPLMQGDLSKGLVPNFVKLNRKNLSDKDKMSDSKLLRKKWRDKMGEIAPYVKQIEKGGARIEIDPIISKLNEEANRIWDELQKLRGGQDYYIPNLADPLQEAIHREKSAGVPSSRIKIEKSSQLKSPMNPMGLAVTNTRDEPGGLAQGIRRAKKQRIDPKRHGIEVPNFATPVNKEEFDKILKDIVSKAESSFKDIEKTLDDIELGDLAKDLKKKFDDSIEKAKKTGNTKNVLNIKDEVETIRKKGVDKFINNPKQILDAQSQHSIGATKDNADKKMAQLEKATKELTSSIEEADIEVQQNTKSQGDNLVKLFALQSIISTTNGFLQEFAESTNTVTRTFAKLGTVASDTVASFVQIQMLGDELANFFESMGKKQKEDEEGGSSGVIEGVAGGAAAGGAARGSMFAGIRNMAARGAQAMQRFIKPVAAVVAGFKLADGVFKNFISDDKMGLYMYAMGSASEKAAHRLELMSKSIEATTAAIENLKKQEENKQKIVELEIKGSGRTIKEDQELLDLRVKSYDVEIAVAKSMAELQKEANEGGFAMRMFSEATKKAGKSTLDKADLESMLQQMKVFQAVVSTNESFANTTDSINNNDKLNDAGKSRGYSLAMLTRSLMDESQASKNEDLFKKLSQAGGEPDSMLERMNFGLKEGVSQEDFRNVFKTLHDGLEESESFFIMDENEAFRQAMKSFIDGFKKNDVSKSLRNLIQSNSEGIKELARRVVIEKHVSKMKMAAAKHENSLNKIINKQTSQRSKFLDEQNLIAKSKLLAEKQSLALEDIQNTEKLSTTNAREKLNQALLEQANKLLVTNNLAEMDVGSMKIALENLKEDLNSAGKRVIESAKTFEKINKGLNPENKITASKEDKETASRIIEQTKKQVEEQLKNVNNNPESTLELQKILTDLYSRLAKEGDENVTALVLASTNILKLREEQIKKIRESKLTEQQEIDAAKKAEAIARKELSLQMESENLTAKTLEGNKTLYKILKDRITDSKTLAKEIQESTMFDMQINDAKLEEYNLRKEIINDLTAQAVEAKIGKNTTELIENLPKRGLSKEEIKSFDPNVSGNELDDRQKKLRTTSILLLADKVGLESDGLVLSNLENDIQQSLIDLSGERKRIAEQKFKQEKSSLETQIQEKAEEIKLLKQSKKMGELVLANETADAERAATSSERKVEQLRNIEKRLELANFLVNSEFNELESQRLTEEAKFQIAANNGKLLGTVQEQLKLETSMLEKDAYLAALKSEQAQLLEGINERQKKAQELLDFSNKIDEARLAANRASIDQRALSGMVGADMQINRFNQRYDTRAAATQAINPNATAEDMLAFTEKLKEFNKTTNNGTEAIDALRVKMAEMQVSASNLKSDLVNTGIENLRTNMVQMFKDIGSGAKSVGDAYRDLGLGLAEAILDRMMQHNVDKIISNLTYAFTGVDPEKEANKFLMENNNAVSANTSALEKLRGQLMKGIIPPPPPEFSKEPTKETAEQIEQDRINNTFKPLLEGLDIKITDFTNAGIGLVESLSGAFEKIRQKLEEIKSEVDAKVDPVTNDTVKTTPFNEKGSGLELELSPDPPVYGTLRQLAKLERDATLNQEKLEVNKNNLKEAEQEKSLMDKPGFTIQNYAPMMPYVPYMPQTLPPTKVEATNYGKIDEEIKGIEEKIKNSTRQAKRHDRLSINKKRLGLPNENHIEQSIKHEEEITNLTAELKSKQAQRKTNTATISKLLEEKVSLAEIEKSIAYQINELEKQLYINKMRESAAQNAITIATEARAASLQQPSATTTTTDSPPAVEPTPPGKNFWGGKIQRFAKGGLVEGPGGIDNVPAMLTAGEYVVPKEEVQNFSGGGRATRFFKGATQAAVMTITADAVNKAMEDQSKKKGPPVFDMKRMNPLALGSDVSLKTGDPRMSGRALAKSQEMQEYKDYLLEKAAYEVDKKNAKFKKRMGYLQQAMGFISSFAVAEVTDILREPLRKTVDFISSPFVKTGKYIGNKASDFFNGDLGFGEYSDAYKAANKTGYDLSYNQIKNSFETGQPIEYTTNRGKKNATTRTLTPQDRRRVGPEGSISYQPGNFLKVTRTRTFDDRAFVDPTRPDSNNMESSYGRRTLRNNSGGKIPSMLTRGEGFIPSSTAKKIGYQNLESMNRTGSLPTIQGPSGIDKVGPVGLDEGDFIIRKSSTDKLMRDNPNTMRFAMQNPDGFRKSATGYYDGGIVGTGSQASFPSNQSNPESPKGNQPVNRIQPLIEAAKSSETEKTSAAQNNEITNNISVNVTIDSSGKESVEAQTPEGSYQQEQELAMKIKTRVLEVIREEKRLGGELDK